MKIKWTNPPARRPINQYSLKELYDNRSPNFLHHDERVAELKEPQIMKAFANTLILRTPSSKFSQNSTFWHQYIMFEDFIQLAKDRDIPLRDAVEFAITDCDAHVFCDCPSQLYWGYKYISTQLGYNYAGYRESRRPDVNNPSLLGTACKHLSNVTLWLMDNIDEVLDWFSVYYQSVVAEDSDPEEDIVSVSSPDSSDVIAETHVEGSPSPPSGSFSEDSLDDFPSEGDTPVLVTEVYSVEDEDVGTEDVPETEPDAGSEDADPDIDVQAVFDDLDDYLDSYADLPDEESEDD